MTRRIAPVVLCAAGIVLGSATVAAAYVTLVDSGTGAAHASAIGAPTSFTATSSLPDQATLSWTAPSDPSPTGYIISQSPGTLAGTCTTLTGSSASCTATGLAPGTPYTWHLTADYASWSSSTSTASVTTVTPSIALTPTSGRGGTLVQVTGSGFAASSHLAFSFGTSSDAPSALTPAKCTPVTTATGLLPAGPCEITIPSTAASAGGTVGVTDAAGDAATAAFNVTAATGLGALSVAPTSVVEGSKGNTLTFTYTASGGALASGEVDVGVAPWVAAGGTAPQTVNASAVGYTVASTGSVRYTGAKHLIEVTGVTLPAGGTLTVTYGSGGGASGVAAPAPSGTSVPYTFTASEISGASGTPGAVATSPQVTVVKRLSAACGAAVVFTLPAHTTVPFSVVGAGGGPGGPANGDGGGLGGGSGGPGAAVAGTLANTTGSTVQLSVLPGCPGGNGGTSPTGGLGGSGYAAGGDGGDAHGGPGAGGGGGGTTSIEIVPTHTYLVVAGGGGGGGGGGTTSAGAQTGGRGGASTARTSSSTAAENGLPGGASSTGTSTGGGAGGGVGSAAAGGAVGVDAPGGGGAGGESYPAGTISVGGVTVSNLSYGTGTPGAAGSATIG